MEKRVLAKVGALLSLIAILAGCAYSNVERDVTSNIDKGVEHTRQKVAYTSSSSAADSYQNASQRTHGAILGGAAGGIAGAFVTSVGTFPGLLVGSIFGASYGAYIDSKSSVADQLQNRGATIVMLGDHILIVLPSSQIFEEMSPRIKPDAYSTLNLVIQYINGFTTSLVKIAAYTNHVPAEDIALCLSKEQAESVSKYFAMAGMDTRLLYAVGYGGLNQVQKSSLSWKENDNYRIEITLEKEYV